MIQEEPKEIYIYDATVIVVKIVDLTIDPRYVYIMLNSDTIKYKLKEIEWQRANMSRGNTIKRKTLGTNLVPRLTTDILEGIRIIKLTEEERHKIVEDYNKINKAQEDFNNKLNRLQTQRKEMPTEE